MPFSELQYQAEIRRLQDRVTMLEFELRGREQELNIARLTVERLAKEGK